MIPLDLLSPGELGEIVAIRPHNSPASAQCSAEREKERYRLEEIGLRIGKSVRVLNNDGGTLLVKVDDEARIAVDRGLAMKIMLREIRR